MSSSSGTKRIDRHKWIFFDCSCSGNYQINDKTTSLPVFLVQNHDSPKYILFFLLAVNWVGYIKAENHVFCNFWLDAQGPVKVNLLLNSTRRFYKFMFFLKLHSDWMLTLQFSFILVCWLFLPLCMVFRPASILSEIFYIR